MVTKSKKGDFYYENVQKVHSRRTASGNDSGSGGLRKFRQQRCGYAGKWHNEWGNNKRNQWYDQRNERNYERYDQWYDERNDATDGNDNSNGDGVMDDLGDDIVDGVDDVVNGAEDVVDDVTGNGNTTTNGGTNANP